MKNPIINPDQSPRIQQIVIFFEVVTNAKSFEIMKDIDSGKQIFETRIIAGVNKSVEIIICHFRIDSIEPDLEFSKKIN